MKMISKVKIGGVWYDVQIVKEMQIVDECSGRAICGKGLIKIEDSLCPDLACATLIHEIFEVIKYENELKLPHRTLQCLATQTYQVIVDNPGLFEQ